MAPENNYLDPMIYEEKVELRNLALKAKRFLDYPLGDLASRELLAWEDFGYRFSKCSMVSDLVEYVRGLEKKDQ